MNYYRACKSKLNWTEMPQIQYNWNLPILVDDKSNVIAGNSLYDCLPESLIVVIVSSYDREILFSAIRDIETKIAEENSEERIGLIYCNILNFLKETRKEKIETISLFDIKEDRLITPETYIEPPAYDFNKHGKIKPQFNDGFYLSEEFIDKVVNSKEPEIEVDLEILKELL